MRRMWDELGVDGVSTASLLFVCFCYPFSALTFPTRFRFFTFCLGLLFLCIFVDSPCLSLMYLVAGLRLRSSIVRDMKYSSQVFGREGGCEWNGQI